MVCGGENENKNVRKVLQEEMQESRQSILICERMINTDTCVMGIRCAAG